MKQHFPITPIRAAVLLALTTPTAFAAVGDPVGAAIAVNTTTAGNQAAYLSNGDVAMDANGAFVMVWTDQSGNDGDGNGVYARRFDAAGTGQGDDFLINTTSTTGNQGNPRVALDADGDFVVVYGDAAQLLNGSHDYGSVYARRYTAAGVAVGDSFVISSHTDGFQDNPDVAMAADGSFIAVWRGKDNNDPGYTAVDDYDIFARRFDADGNPLGNDFKVNTVTANPQYQPRVAADARGNFVVVWQDDTVNNSDGAGAAIMARRYSASGTALDATEVVVNATTAGNQYQPEVAMDADGNFVVSWRDTTAYVRPFGSDGTPAGEIQLPIASGTGLLVGLGGVAMDADGDFAVTWGEFLYGDPIQARAYIQRYDRTGTQVNTTQLVASAAIGSVSNSGAVAMDADGDTVTLYTDAQFGGDVFAQRYVGGDTGATGDKQADLKLTVVDDTGGAAIRPYTPLTYTFTVTNQNGTGAAVPGIALGVSLTDVLPAGLVYSSFASVDAWNCSDSAGTVTCTLPSLDAGASSTLDVTVDTSGMSATGATNNFSVSNGVTEYNATDNNTSLISYFDLTPNNVPTFDATPSISGTAEAGNTLIVINTATTDLDGDTVTLSYQWLRDGVAISGATGASYVAQQSDTDKAISATVTANDGYGGITSVTTAAVSVTAASSGGSGGGGGGAFGWLSLFAGLLLFRRRT